jgi:hypothetical protein
VSLKLSATSLGLDNFRFAGEADLQSTVKEIDDLSNWLNNERTSVK